MMAEVAGRGEERRLAVLVAAVPRDRPQAGQGAVDALAARLA